MKSEKPFNLVLFGSLIVTVFVALFITIFIFFEILPDNYLYYFLPIAVGIISFFSFGFLIRKYINKKIKSIHQIISREKLVKGSEKTNTLQTDALDKLTEEAEKWADERKKEITQLKKQAEFRKEFLGNLAHELKTPVFSAQGYVLSLLEGGLDDPKVNRDFLIRASKAMDRITAILDDLDDIMRYEANRYDLNRKNFDIVETTKEVLDSLEYKAKEKEIKLVFKEDYNPIMVKADVSKITQVLTNLIVNSINYGNINGKTTIRFSKLENGILVEVSDDGLGIAEEHLPRLFERFYRIEKSRARNQGGSGLGLAIAKHIIEAHGHSINVKSTEGVGSSFSFSLDKA